MMLPATHPFRQMSLARWKELPWRERLYMQGVAEWAPCYAHDAPSSGETRDAWAQAYLGAVLQTHLGISSGETPPSLPWMGTLAATKWVHGGCRTMEAGAKYFAAMAATSAHADAAKELRVPWPVFVIEVPPGILVSSDGAEYRHMVLAQFDGLHLTTAAGPARVPVTAWVTLHTAESGDYSPVLNSLHHGTLADLLFGEQVMSGGGVGTDGQVWCDLADGDEALLSLAKRAAAGLLFTMQHTNHFRQSGSGLGGIAKREAPPPHRVVIIGRPLGIDCREAVRSAACGRRSSLPSVQTLVRGHIKRQVVGPGRTGRKVIWVEPYWRGPEEAPILARPYRIGGNA